MTSTGPMTLIEEIKAIKKLIKDRYLPQALAACDDIINELKI